MATDLRGSTRPVEDLTELVAGHDLVLLGEATHGTREFYELRAEVTRRLIRDHGFRGIAWEADWPPTAQLSRWIRGEENASGPAGGLNGFAERFPTWMWRNETIRDLAVALRDTPVGIYGLDLYSLRTSMAEVVAHLERIDPDAAARARARYACFDHFGGPDYGWASTTGRLDPCETEVVEALLDLQQRATPARGGRGDAESAFLAEQNARIAVDAERYYRAMYRGRESTWNLRDRHMADALDAVREHVGGPVVVWAHNSHVGDARATDRGDLGEVTLGQLVRERHGDRCVLVGQTTATGTVTAAHDWDDPPQTFDVRPPLEGSVERVLHEAGIERGLLDLRAGAPAGLDRDLLQRMIGVVYRPATERQSHYVQARVGDQYDLLVHVDRTSRVMPLDRPRKAEDGPDGPETIPTGL